MGRSIRALACLRMAHEALWGLSYMPGSIILVIALVDGSKSAWQKVGEREEWKERKSRDSLLLAC